MRRKLEIIGLSLAWLTILTQFVLMLYHRQTDITEMLIRFFSYFTIQTNLLVAFFFTSAAFNLRRGFFRIFKGAGSLTAVTAFILVVGIVYQVALRSLWHPTGLQYLVDELLHTVIPLYTFIFWWIYVKKANVRKNAVLIWLIYPITYLGFVMTRGAISGFYPYYFLNLDKIGVLKTFVNLSLITLATLSLLLALVYLGKKIDKS
ncbi:Pr6Pr family membrane protein [Sphingobacterium sp. LRF_L2]|uniref:Pr6Pr family membrane protein n=1 Tax=Sphingobacterium sp. LRF_L2 TaxID=3369421 RepID=UPI003F642939